MATNLIKNLQTTHPRGSPIGTADLQRMGISPALAHEYVASGWLQRLGRGVFMFAGDMLGREACVRFLATKIEGLHVAGATALAWHGHRHNIAARETLCLHGVAKVVLPEWFTERYPARYGSGRLFDAQLAEGYGLAVLPETPSGPLVSVPERALLEMLSAVGVHQEAEEARSIMESIRHVRTKEFAELLQHCRMVKAARLCVLWSKELALPWAAAAREAAAGKLGSGRWIKQMKNGKTLTLKKP